HRDRIFFLFEAENRRNGAENLLLHEPHLRLRVRNHRRFEEGATSSWRFPPVTILPPLAVASPTSSSTFSTAFMSINGPCWTPSSRPGPTLRVREAAASFSTNLSWMPA